MDAHDQDLSLLNVYEVEDEGRIRHLVGFQDGVLAGSIGLVSHAMVGEYEPEPDGTFNPDTFKLNTEFLDAAKQFLNAQAKISPELIEGATQVPGERLFLVDPRNHSEGDEEPPAEDVLGWYDVDDTGHVVENSFVYNPQHAWFSKSSGASGLLANRAFYEFLHPTARRQQ
jgi:hypothetical protein